MWVGVGRLHYIEIGLRPGAADLGIPGKCAFSGFSHVCFLFFNRKIDLSINKSITRSKMSFAKNHKISMFRYRKIGFGCLKYPRMIPGTK